MARLNPWVGETLILHGYAELTGDALPQPLLTDPRIREPAPMLERFAMVYPLLVKGADHDSCISVNMDRHIVRFQDFKLSIGIASKSYLSCFVDNASIGFGHHKIIGHEPTEAGGIVMEFGYNPIVLSCDEITGGGVCLCWQENGADHQRQ
jgi:hypothetical protein